MKTLLAALMSLAFAVSAVAQTADWQKTWEAAAKKEGKVVIIGSPDPVGGDREEGPRAFEAMRPTM